MRLKAYRMAMSKGSSEAKKTWEVLRGVLNDYGCLPDIILASGNPHKNDLKKYFRYRPDSLIVDTGIHKVMSNLLGTYHFYQTFLDEKQPGPDIWDDVAMSFVSHCGFRQAYIFDVEYDRWQNVTSIQSYELNDRDYSHLPLRHNNLPPPLDGMDIDISRNPGRWAFRQGYVEAVGSTMWLGGDFWKLVGEHRRDALLAANWADVKEVASGVLRVQVAPEPFCDDSTADLQDRLRQTLYPDVDE